MKYLTRCVLLGAILAMPAATNAQAPRVIPDVVYGHKDGLALTFDVFMPQRPNGAGVIYIVSGGWRSQWRDPAEAQESYTPFLDAGFAVFAVRHGSSPRYLIPDAIADVMRANRYIHLHAEEWGVDADRLSVTGSSAGGHLSLMIGNNGDDGDPNAADPLLRVPSRVAAVVAYYPVVTLLTWPDAEGRQRFPATQFSPQDVESVSPVLHATADDPPTLLIHGTADALVPIAHSEAMRDAFERVGVRTDLVRIVGAGHGFRDGDAITASDARVQWLLLHTAD